MPTDTEHSGPVMGGIVRPMPVTLVNLLMAAREVESRATGLQRRGAFRTTRSLLAGAVALGWSTSQLATVMGTRASSVADRAIVDDLIPTEVFCDMAGMPVSRIEEWKRNDILGAATAAANGDLHYRASELIRALLVSGEATSSRPSSR